ncbi:serine/threonine protein kinase [Solibacillus daqui]|uniref:serine/threonine protein kinase n=1 Tax=Solibacillus daqui TaxID=2912187 RepID=UPI002365FAA2|nr:protein kinase [Solibacillus daqui]
MIFYFLENKYRKRTEHYIQQYTDYELITILGEGSYGVAYLLQHRKSKEQVVLKRLKANQLKPTSKQRFIQEMALLQELQHLPVPKFIASGFIGDAPYYLMSFVDGYTFEKAIFEQQQTYSIDDTISITKDLLYFVQQLHEKNIVHRDLRIPNVLVADDGLHIIDFGLATNIDAYFNLHGEKNPKKAPHPLSDLYAVGHFMLFLLYSIYEPQAKKSTTWQQELQLPVALQHYIERLLTIKTPFQNASEALQALQQLRVYSEH